MRSLPSLLPAASSLLAGPQLIGGGWSRHHDGGSQFNATELHYLQVFYYPAECTPEMGPTELCPGENLHDTSHFSPL